MKFGKYLKERERPEWSGKYLDYAALKDLIKVASKEQEAKGFAGEHASYSPRAASLTVLRGENARDSTEEKFFQKLEEEVDKIGTFTSEKVQELRSRLYQLQQRVDGGEGSSTKGTKEDELLEEAKDIGDQFLQLEKYVNLNYMGFHKILKKHDKQLPHSPCRQFYMSHLHNQPWVQGSYADLLVSLGNVYAQIRGDEKDERLGSAQDGLSSQRTFGVNQHDKKLRSSTKYWIPVAEVSAVKHMILPHLPVYQFEENEYTGDSQLVNSVYLDNSTLEVYHNRLKEEGKGVMVKLSWYGSQEPLDVHVQRKVLVARKDLHSILHDRHDEIHNSSAGTDEFILPSSMILSFIEGELDLKEAIEFWHGRQIYINDMAAKSALFEDLKKLVDSKQLKPVLRSQCMRTYFQIPFDGTVRIKMDTNISMMKENPEDGPSCISIGRWFRDPSLPVHRTEVTRFPHAVLDLNLSLASDQETPSWVQELVSSGILDEVNSFSKHLHGMTTLFPDMVQSVPYWVDRESVRASMLNSAPDKSTNIAPTARDIFANAVKPRHGTEDEHQQLVSGHPQGESREHLTRKLYKTPKFIEWWFRKPPMGRRPNIPGRVEQKIEPKTFFANERTFLSWLHMALTMGSIATAMIGISSDETQNSSTMIALILLPAALLMCFYSVIVYYWRSSAILHHKELYYDDRRGPLALTCVIVTSLSVILAMGVIELVEELNSEHSAPSDTSSWLANTMIGKALGLRP